MSMNGEESAFRRNLHEADQQAAMQAEKTAERWVASRVFYN
jgi:hypothetical protein